MATVYQCDRCNKISKKKLAKVKLEIETPKDAWEEVELCEKCMRYVRHEVKNPPPEAA